MTALGYGAVDKVSKTGDSMTGTLVLSGSTPLQVTTTSPGAGKVLVSDPSGNVSWGMASVSAPLTLSSGQASSSILSITNTTAAPSIAALVVTSQAAGDRSVGVQVAGDTNRRLMVDSNGVHSWGSGTAAGDTNLYRSAAGTLQTDNNLSVAGTLTATGAATLSAGVTVTGAGSVSGNLSVNGNLSVGGVGKTLYVAKPANASVTSSALLTNDPDLTVSLAANATYLMTSTLKYEADTAGDINVAWTAPAGASNVGTMAGLLSSATSDANVFIIGFTINNSNGNAAGGLGAGTVRSIFFSGTLTTGATAGSITLQWAQKTTSSIATILYAGSFLSLQRVA